MHISKLYSKRTLLFSFSILAILIICKGAVLADSYNVTAVVPYDPPTIPATVISPSDNSTTNINNVNITGNCQILNPAIIVSVWNGSTLIGSTACLASGSYSINVGLYIGTNVLVVKSNNINGLYGPDSTPYTIVYRPDNRTPDPTPEQPTGGTPTKPVGPANNPSNSGELVITSTTTFSVIDNNNSVSITLRISGGNNPYSLVINWGDGSTTTQDLKNEGDYTFSHIYETANFYNIKALVTDVLGKNQIFNLIVSPGALSQINDDKNVVITTENGVNLKPYVYTLLALTTVFLIFSTFLIGRYYQTLQLNKNAKKPANKKVDRR